MHIKKILLLFIITLCSKLHAQEAYIDAPPGKLSSGTFTMYGTAGLGDAIPYSNIGSSPFWSDDWKLATIYGRTEKEKWIKKIRLNFATGEIHYLESEKELVITDGFVKKIIFHKGEDLKSTDATFIYIQEAVEENKQITNAFVQVMNNGKYELLKLNTRTLSQKDSLFGTVKAYRFVNNTKYFIYNSHKAEPIKKLSPDFILPFFIHAESYNEWIAKNKIDLKKEADVVRFINYYNSIATPTN